MDGYAKTLRGISWMETTPMLPLFPSSIWCNIM